MFQQSLGKISRLSLKRKVPDGNGLKNCSNYHETVQIRSANLRELNAPKTKINLICINWPTSLVIPTCPMCKSAPEDLPHFVLACPSLSTPRDKLLPRIKRLATDLGMYLPQDQDILCKSLLNSANPESCCACSGRSRVSKHPIKCKCSRLNDMISQLCLDLHNGRTQALSQTPS